MIDWEQWIGVVAARFAARDLVADTLLGKCPFELGGVDGFLIALQKDSGARGNVLRQFLERLPDDLTGFGASFPLYEFNLSFPLSVTRVEVPTRRHGPSESPNDEKGVPFQRNCQGDGLDSAIVLEGLELVELEATMNSSALSLCV